MDTGAGQPSAAQQAEVQQIMAREQQMMMVQAAITRLTEVCWDKCIGGDNGKEDSSFGSRQERCIKNTAMSYLRASELVAKRVQAQAQAQAGGMGGM